MPIIHHRDQALIQHSYRRIVTQAEGALSERVGVQHGIGPRFR
jgi:hypothetical protein